MKTQHVKVKLGDARLSHSAEDTRLGFLGNEHEFAPHQSARFTSENWSEKVPGKLRQSHVGFVIYRTSLPPKVEEIL